MDIIYYHPKFNVDYWITHLQQALPDVQVRVWQEGDNQPADYALVWNPPVDMLRGRTSLKAVFVLGAGVDGILDKLKSYPDMLPAGVPLFRLEDTGMGLQMQEYAVSQVLHWFRRFDDYQRLKRQARWEPLPVWSRKDFTVGILGAGILGKKVAQSLLAWDFPLRCWSRSPKSWSGITSYAGDKALNEFLQGTRVLINLLPNTPQTAGIINAQRLCQLPDGAFILNLARGAHLIEEDLLDALNRGKIKGAMLDVFNTEPLPQHSPLWTHPRVNITPHIAAFTQPDRAIAYIATAIEQLKKGEMPSGQVSLKDGY